jgi:hypothetical protein
VKVPVAALAAFLYALALAPAFAAVEHGRAWQATYVAAYQPTFGRQGVPYSGTLKLKFNDGIVSGTYAAESVRPDPLYGRTINVSGGVSQGHITLDFRASGGSPSAERSPATERSPARRRSAAAFTVFSLR